MAFADVRMARERSRNDALGAPEHYVHSRLQSDWRIDAPQMPHRPPTGLSQIGNVPPQRRQCRRSGLRARERLPCLPHYTRQRDCALGELWGSGRSRAQAHIGRDLATTRAALDQLRHDTSSSATPAAARRCSTRSKSPSRGTPIIQIPSLLTSNWSAVFFFPARASGV